MGAEHVVQIITGSTLTEAFNCAQEEAGRLYGYSYSGTISQAAGIKLVRASGAPLVTVRTEKVKDLAKITVVYGRPALAATPTSWAVAGIYSS
jgi:hypothetical protein